VYVCKMAAPPMAGRPRSGENTLGAKAATLAEGGGEGQFHAPL
jgi:hypothetical protein